MISGFSFKKVLLLLSLAVSIVQISSLAIISEASPSPVRIYQSRGHANGEEIGVGGVNDSAGTFFSQGLTYYDQGRWQAAIRAFERAARAEPGYELAYFALGITYSRLEFWEKALASFAKAIALSPDHAESYLGLGVTYTVLGRNNDALEVCKKAVQIKPEYAQAHYALALIYLKLGDRDSAVKEWGVLKKLDPILADEVMGLIDNDE
jgi:tetratricopeptide (TPR) repeat protein